MIMVTAINSIVMTTVLICPALIDTIDIHSLNNSERIALLRILVSYTVPKLAIEKPSLNTEERLFQVEIIDSKRK